MSSVLAHVLLFNSPDSILRCVESLLAQEGFSAGGLHKLEIVVSDNASQNEVLAKVEAHFADKVTIQRNVHNLGYCGGHNWAAKVCRDKGYDFLLVLNPDVRLETTALGELVQAASTVSNVGSATPLLYRASEDLDPIEPRTIDAAGMYMTPALRHLDRGSGEGDTAEYHHPAFMFGGTGACLLLKRSFIDDVALSSSSQDLFRIYPQLQFNQADRIPLFDEAFFAYREDADLAWRGQLLGWRCLFVPSAVAYHRRVVTPERRSKLPAELNRNSVRNRFLLQINNYSFGCGFKTVVHGLVGRNLLVILGAFIWERASLSGIWEVGILLRRALQRRREVMRRAKVRNLSTWFLNKTGKRSLGIIN